MNKKYLLLYYRKGKNIGPFYSYTNDGKILIYSIIQNKDNFFIKVNNYQFTTNEIIKHATSDRISFNKSTTKLSLDKDKINIFYSFLNKFKVNFLNIFLPKIYLSNNCPYSEILIIILGIIMGLILFSLQSSFYIKMTPTYMIPSISFNLQELL
ncbi:hypothetical protein M2092_002223 [Fusobacterium sp. PH5-44]|uniref:hypothetical protein n=1 Tax=Fusobacterium sp. PH5-29 TaxID=1742400 RepID=UPI003D212BFF